MEADERGELHAATTDRLCFLMAATAKGDQAAFAELYRLTSPKLMGVAMRLMRARDQADEVLQDAYVRVWHKARLYDPARGTALVWMVAILRRCALDRLRQASRKQREVAIDDVGAEALQISDDFDPNAAADARRVNRCLDRLDESKREAIKLSFYYGLTHEEVASHLQAPVGTVKSWIRRGLKALKDCLGQ